jgi:hypothetical protein
VKQQHKKIIDHVMANIRNFTSTTYNQTFLESAQAFINAVNWREEKWLQILIGFHIVFLFIIIMTRQKTNLQAFFFFLICGLVICAQQINSLAGQYWSHFSTQNYFDESGLFISTVFSAPLLLNGTFILSLFLLHTAQLLIRVKRLQFSHERREQQRKKNE